MDVADKPAMFSLSSCLAPAFCFFFRRVLSIVKRLICRRVLWMSFVIASVWCCLLHTCQPLVLLHSLPLRPFPLLISSGNGIISSLISSGIIYVISWQQKYYEIWTLLPGQPCSPELCALRLPSASSFVWCSLLSNVLVSFLGVCCGCRLSLPMFSLTSCLAPAFCFFFRRVLSIVKRPSLISRRVLWMSFVSASVCCCLIHTCQPLVLLHSLPRRPFPLLLSYGIIYSLISSGIIYVISWQKEQRDSDVAARPAMFSLTPCLAPAFCFFFRRVLSIVKRPSLISRRVLWMSFVSASVCCCLIHTCQPLVLLHPFHLGATWPPEHASGG